MKYKVTKLSVLQLDNMGVKLNEWSDNGKWLLIGAPVQVRDQFYFVWESI